MATRQEESFEAAERVHALMTAEATGNEASRPEYHQLRRQLMSDPVAWKHAPRVLRTCRTLDQFWGFIQPRFATYRERRTYLHEEFQPLLDVLENFAASPADELAAEAARTLDAAAVTASWERALERRSSDPPGAVTAARTMIESVCKTILDDAGIAYAPRDDLPKLYRMVAEELRLAPSQHTEEQFKRILGGCQSVVEGLGSVRNRDSDSHGHGRLAVRPAPRHAALAVNLAGSMASFLIETWSARQAEREAANAA